MPMSPRLLRPRAAGGFDPRAISGLALWLDASDASTVTLNGSAVSQWRDKSGNSRHASQSVAANQPLYDSVRLNGLRTVTCDVNSKWLSGAAPASTAYTTFVVARIQNSSPSFGRVFTLARAASTDNVSPSYTPLVRSFGNADLLYSFNDTFQAAFSVPGNQWSVLCSNAGGSVISNRRNNGTASTFTSAVLSGTNFTRYGIGTAFPNDTFSGIIGDFAEVLLFSTNLPTAEETSIARYLGAKWGVTVA